MSKLLTNYCSCVFQVKGKRGLAGERARSGGLNPYAVCAKSVYQRRGERGPGALACRFTRKVLDTYDLPTLRGWLLFEGVVPQSKAAKLDKEAAALLIHDYLAHKQPKRAIRVGEVGKRQSPPRRVWRSPKARGSPRSPQARRRAV